MRAATVSSLVAVLLLLVPVSLAQNFSDFNSGWTPYQTYHGGEIDSINAGTGSLNLHIPLVSFPQRGGRLRLTFAINYNSTTVVRQLIGTGANAYWQWSNMQRHARSRLILCPMGAPGQHLTRDCEGAEGTRICAKRSFGWLASIDR